MKKWNVKAVKVITDKYKDDEEENVPLSPLPVPKKKYSGIFIQNQSHSFNKIFFTVFLDLIIIN